MNSLMREFCVLEISQIADLLLNISQINRSLVPNEADVILTKADDKFNQLMQVMNSQAKQISHLRENNALLLAKLDTMNLQAIQQNQLIKYHREIQDKLKNDVQQSSSTAKDNYLMKQLASQVKQTEDELTSQKIKYLAIASQLEKLQESLSSSQTRHKQDQLRQQIQINETIQDENFLLKERIRQEEAEINHSQILEQNTYNTIQQYSKIIDLQNSQISVTKSQNETVKSQILDLSQALNVELDPDTFSYQIQQIIKEEYVDKVATLTQYLAEMYALIFENKRVDNPQESAIQMMDQILGWLDAESVLQATSRMSSIMIQIQHIGKKLFGINLGQTGQLKRVLDQLEVCVKVQGV